MKYALLDDDIHYHEVFKNVTKDYLNLSNCEYFINDDQLSDYLNKNNGHIDVLFLDIDLNGKSGIDIARKLRMNNSSIIIIMLTSMNEYVYDAYGINVMKFIYKPIFPKIVNTIFKEIIYEVEQNKKIKITYQDEITFLSLKEIVVVKKIDRHIVFITNDNKYHISNILSIKDALNIINSNAFFQINRSVIVNINYIKTIKANRIIFTNINEIEFISLSKINEILERWSIINE